MVEKDRQEGFSEEMAFVPKPKNGVGQLAKEELMRKTFKERTILLESLEAQSLNMEDQACILFL